MLLTRTQAPMPKACGPMPEALKPQRLRPETKPKTDKDSVAKAQIENFELAILLLDS